jgi:hypothetical protein
VAFPAGDASVEQCGFGLAVDAMGIEIQFLKS